MLTMSDGMGWGPQGPEDTALGSAIASPLNQ
jgi:hypothetical protein